MRKKLVFYFVSVPQLGGTPLEVIKDYIYFLLILIYAKNLSTAEYGEILESVPEYGEILESTR